MNFCWTDLGTDVIQQRLKKWKSGEKSKQDAYAFIKGYFPLSLKKSMNGHIHTPLYLLMRYQYSCLRALTPVECLKVKQYHTANNHR